jgi:hypothetical protein
MNALNVEKPSLLNHLSLYIREVILGKILMNVVNVGKPFPRNHPSLYIREHTLGKKTHEYNHCGKVFSPKSQHSHWREAIQVY